MNIVLLVGNVGKKPEVQPAGQDHRVCRFSVAVSDGPNRPDLWINVEAWDQLADLIAQHVVKGQKVTVLGEYARAEWMKDDRKFRSDFVRARNVQWDRKSGASSPAAAAPPEGDRW